MLGKHLMNKQIDVIANQYFKKKTFSKWLSLPYFKNAAYKSVTLNCGWRGKYYTIIE